MSRPARRVVDLILLATDAGASEAEARTAALLACRLLRQHGMLADMPRGSCTRVDGCQGIEGHEPPCRITMKVKGAY
jgi:hypothetical protein